VAKEPVPRSPFRRMLKFVAPHTGACGLLLIILYPISYSLYSTYLSRYFGKAEEFWNVLEHVVYTLGVLFIFRSIESTLDFRETSERYIGEIIRRLDNHREELRDTVLPLSSFWGLIGARKGIDFGRVFEDAEVGSTISIFFTFHPSLADSLPKIVKLMHDKNIRLNLLIGDYQSNSILRRFNYIGWLGEDGRDPTYVDRLRNFITVEIPNSKKQYRPIEARDMLRVRTFNHLPDIPIIIESRSAITPYSDYEDGVVDNVPQNITRVLTGFYVLKPAVQGILLEWRSTSGDSLAEAFLTYFNARWESGSAIG
jgi:hypothetical protein